MTKSNKVHYRRRLIKGRSGVSEISLCGKVYPYKSIEDLQFINNCHDIDDVTCKTCLSIFYKANKQNKAIAKQTQSSKEQEAFQKLKRFTISLEQRYKNAEEEIKALKADEGHRQKYLVDLKTIKQKLSDEEAKLKRIEEINFSKSKTVETLVNANEFLQQRIMNKDKEFAEERKVSDSRANQIRVLMHTNQKQADRIEILNKDYKEIVREVNQLRKETNIKSAQIKELTQGIKHISKAIK